MPKSYLPGNNGGACIVAEGTPGLVKSLQVAGDRFSTNAEAAIAAAPASVTLREPVQNLVVMTTVAGYVALSADDLANTPNGAKKAGRFFLQANERRVLPWWQDEVHFKALAGAGTIYIEGRI